MTQDASLFVLFGATGDLAQRMLLPSLYGLEVDGLLPKGLRILGTARSSLDDAGFRAAVAESIHSFVPKAQQDEPTLARLLERVHYQPAVLDDDASMQALADRIHALRDGDIVYHLSTAPKFYAAACEALGRHGLAGPGTRVMLEKPIGKDLATAIAINDGVTRVFDEERVYRVDHYLGKEGVQNLLALRFGNALFEPLWNARHIEQVQITVAETVGVEGRGDYYDGSGAIRDMLQNHLLQLLSVVAMEAPSGMNAEVFSGIRHRPERRIWADENRPIVLEPSVRATPSWRNAPDAIDMARVRAAIHAGRKIRLAYRDEEGRASDRVIWPVSVGYMETKRLLIGWCELRGDFRTFRTDRVAGAVFLEDRFPERPAILRAKWRRAMEAMHAAWRDAPPGG